MHRRSVFPGFIIGLLLAGCAAPGSTPYSVPLASPLVGPPAQPARAGDTFVYQMRNAYNGELRGDVQYRVDKTDGDRAIVAVTTNSPYAGLPHTEIYTIDGNWLRHPLVNHNQVVDYDFAPLFPAYPFPLEPGKTWSMRVNATNPLTGRMHSVRVDGAVLGGERITTPAGTFDAVKIRRRIYAGDWEGFLQETNIVELDWYAPALGRPVRVEINSSWLDTSRSPGGGGIFGGGILRSNQLMRGDWSVFELVSYQAQGKGAGNALEVAPGTDAAPR